MAEISNKALALLVLTALVVVVAATTVQLNRLNAIGITGMPTADDGTVVLQIASSVSIEVDTGNSSINFGPCTPLSGQNLTFDSENNMTNATNDRCVPNPATGQTGFILVRNIGNVDANVTVQTDLTPDGFIPTAASNQADFQVRFTSSNCGAGGSLLSTYTTLSTSAIGACQNLTFPDGEMQMYVNITIPQDALPGAANTNTITYTAAQAGI